MQDSSTSGKKPIQEVEELRAHKAKLEPMSQDISKRTKIAEALRESEERYRSLFEQSPIGIGLATPDGKVVSCNKAMEVITGYSLAELKKVNITDTYENPEDRKALLEAIERHGSVVNFPVRKKRKDGTSYIALLNVSRVSFGDTDLFQTICIDITEHKKAQEQLEQSKEFLANTINALDDPVFVKDQQHRWVILNDAACAVMGRPREELIGKSDYDLFPKEQADVFWERDDSVLRSGKTDVNEEEITWHGKLHTISTKKSVFTDSLSGKKFIAGTIRDITDRKRAEDALCESEERYGVLVGNIPGMVYRGKTDWSVDVIFNPEKICGYSVEEFTSQKVNWAQIIHPDDREKVFAEASKIEKESVSIIQEYRIKAKDGTVRWVEDHKVSIVTDTGIFVGVDGVVFDVTERKKTEEALRKSEECYRTLYESSRDGIATASLNGTITECNQAYADMLGYSREELKKIRYQDITPSRWHAFNEKIFQEVMERGYSDVFEKEYIRKDGTVFPVSLHAWRIDDEDGNPIGVGSIVRDITEHKKAEEKLRKSEKTARAILNATYDLAFLIDTEGTMLALNETFAKRFGKRVDELVGSCVYDLLPPDVAEKRKAQADKVIRSGNPLRFEDERQGKYLDNSIYPVFDAQGKVERLAVFSSDITERKKAEEALSSALAWQEAVFEGARDAVFISDVDSMFIMVNSAACKLTGFSKDELLGMRIPDLHKEEDLVAYNMYHDRIMAGAEIISEAKILRKDGTKVDTEFNNRCIKISGTAYMHTVARDITGRKKAEERIREQSEFLRNTIESLTHPFYVIDVNDYTIKMANSAATGVESLGEGITCYALTHRLDKPCVSSENLCPIVEIKKTRKRAVVEHTHYDENGKKRTFEVHAYPIFDEEQNVSQVIEYSLDITERKKAEEALRESEEKLRTLVERANDGIAILQDGLLKYVNPRTAEITGYTVKEMTNTPFDRYVAPDELPKLTEAYERRMAGEEIPSIYETVVRRKDGRNVYIEVNAGLVTYEGKPADLAFARDITERKKAEEALRQSEERYHNIFNSATDAIFVLDLEDHIVDANTEACKMYGYSYEDIIGLTAQKLIHPDYRCKPENYEDEIKRTGETYMEAINLRKDGTPFNVEFRGTVFDHHGRKHLLIFVRDITERKRAEERLLDYQRKLKSLASELSLTEERERRRIATELHDRISQSLVISKMNLEALRKTRQGQEFDRTLEEICNSLGQTIVDTRTLTFDLSSPILYELGFEAAVAEWLAEQVQDKYGIESEFEDDGRPKPLDDDIRLLLFRNVRELLINVVKHAQAKKIKVSIGKVGNEICISVEDDGVGFDPDQPVSMAAETSGFGLFSIRQGLEQTGGSFKIKSEPGRGCKVTMTAPLKQE